MLQENYTFRLVYVKSIHRDFQNKTFAGKISDMTVSFDMFCVLER